MIGDYSLYFHIPFCSRKCDYCHFYVIPDKHQHKQQYLIGLEKEWHLRAPMLSSTSQLISIYFGGGTPALLGPESIRKILNWIKPNPNLEITLEANPENINLALIKEYASIGINRISLGVQTFDPKLLTTLGRTHSAQKSLESIYYIKEAGIENISIDLMYDLPGQTLSSWQNTLSYIATLPITHLSLYNLTIEPYTVFYKQRKALKPLLPDEHVSLAMLNLAIETLQANQFDRYEISAFCKNDLYSRHNTGYWSGRPFLGFGPSAFSYWEGKRFRNQANLSLYCKRLNSNIMPVDFEEELPHTHKIKELLAIGLRMLSGINLSAFTAIYGNLPSDLVTSIQLLIEQKLLSRKQEQLSLTEQGLLFYDYVAEQLV